MNGAGGEDEVKKRQRETVAALARQKVLAAYRKVPQNFQSPAEMPSLNQAETTPKQESLAQVEPAQKHEPLVQVEPGQKQEHLAQEETAPKQEHLAQEETAPKQEKAPAKADSPDSKRMASATTIENQTEDWRNYHSAWQDYYQRYYGEYYGKAAQAYLAQEQLKFERKRNAEAEAHDEELRKKVLKELASDDGAKNQKQKIWLKQKRTKLMKSRHFIPIMAGVTVFLLGVLFQYNQVIIANAIAYMSPNGDSKAGITALDATVTVSTHADPTLMIPKLNVEVPVRMGAENDLKSMDEAMSNGVAQFRVPGAQARPGEVGNFVVTGHSAGNIYQQSEYKFIFSGLTRMVSGDMIYMDYVGKRYGYRVVGTKVVEPSDVAALVNISKENAGKPMITLLTCTPLGTSRQRLLVFAEQISPSYKDAPSQAPANTEKNDGKIAMPANQASPLEQFWHFLTGQH